MNQFHPKWKYIICLRNIWPSATGTCPKTALAIGIVLDQQAEHDLYG
jgi:hypothetical protein